MSSRWKFFAPMFLFIVALALFSAWAKNPDGLGATAGRTPPLTILGPVSAALNAGADFVERLWTRYFALVNAQVENENLRKTVSRLRRRNVELEESREGALRLEKLLRLKDADPEAYLAARILAWDPGPWFQAVVIDQGSRDGVPPEAAVICDEGLVGRVVELAPRQAKVLLVTDRSSGVDAFIQRNRANVLVTGSGPGRLELSYAKKGEDARLGDLAVSSGLDGIFPPGLPLGVISQVDKAGLGLFLRAELRPAVDFSGLKEVLVRLKKPQAFDWTVLGEDVFAIFEKKNHRPAVLAPKAK
jgi:rod shape-determining protein MreC